VPTVEPSRASIATNIALSKVEEGPALGRRRILAYRSLRGTAASDNLDLVRGVAAIAVLFAHFRQGFFPTDIPKNPNLLTTAVYFATAYGHIAVIVFFVLSGYLIGGSVLREWLDGEFSWSYYAVNRLTRLWIVLIPALLLTLIWDHIGIHLFGTAGIYGVLGKTDALALHRLSWRVLLSNLFFLQEILTPTLGSNGPLWSLSSEFWYYLLFPLILLAIPSKKPGWSSALYAAAALAILFFVGQKISTYFLIWLLGAAINLAPEKRNESEKRWVFAALGGVAIVASLNLDKDFVRDLVLGAAAAALIFGLLRNPAGSRRSRPGPYSRTARRLAGFSYTLYLTHASPMVFASAWLVPSGTWRPDMPHVATLAGLGVCVVAYSLVIAHLTESRTGAVRLRVTKALGL
jgi:peptidoglycan/LPS O-acetylase OafA/YrhL